MRNDLEVVLSKLPVDFLDYVEVVEVRRYEESSYDMLELIGLCKGEYFLITIDDRDKLNSYASIDFHAPTHRVVVESVCYDLVDGLINESDDNYPFVDIMDFADRVGEINAELSRLCVRLGYSELKDGYDDVPYVEVERFNHVCRVVFKVGDLRGSDVVRLLDGVRLSREKVESIFQETVMYTLLDFKK